jgi:methylthioribose-1-phosphate isomerase
MTGRAADGSTAKVQVVPDGSPALNIGFDVTPARLITGLLTERGLCAANRAALRLACADQRAVNEGEGA